MNEKKKRKRGWEAYLVPPLQPSPADLEVWHLYFRIVTFG